MTKPGDITEENSFYTDKGELVVEDTEEAAA